jgi:uncharacterized membrane protein YkoI
MKAIVLTILLVRMEFISSAQQQHLLATLPPAAQNVARTQMGSAWSIEKKLLNGHLVFEICGKNNGREAELTITPEGQVISSGHEINLAEVPPALQGGIRKYSANTKLESIICQVEGDATTYRLDLKKGTRDCSIELDQDGNLLNEEIALGITELPAAAQKTVRDEVGPGRLLSLKQVIENGDVSFSIAAIKDDKPLDFLVGTNGDLAELEMSALDLPDIAQKTVQDHIGNGRITRTTKNSDDGDVFYAVEIHTGKKIRTLNIATDGSLISEDEPVTLPQTPEPVQRAISARASGAAVTGITKTMADNEVFYEIELVRAGKHLNFQLNPDGKERNAP